MSTSQQALIAMLDDVKGLKVDMDAALTNLQRARTELRRIQAKAQDYADQLVAGTVPESKVAIVTALIEDGDVQSYFADVAAVLAAIETFLANR